MEEKGIVKKTFSISESKSIDFSTKRSIPFALLSANQNDVDLYNKKGDDKDSDYIMYGDVCSRAVYPNKELEITHFVMCDHRNVHTFKLSSAAALTSQNTKITTGNNCLLPVDI